MWRSNCAALERGRGGGAQKMCSVRTRADVESIASRSVDRSTLSLQARVIRTVHRHDPQRAIQPVHRVRGARCPCNRLDAEAGCVTRAVVGRAPWRSEAPHHSQCLARLAGARTRREVREHRVVRLLVALVERAGANARCPAAARLHGASGGRERGCGAKRGVHVERRTPPAPTECPVPPPQPRSYAQPQTASRRGNGLP